MTKPASTKTPTLLFFDSARQAAVTLGALGVAGLALGYVLPNWIGFGVSGLGFTLIGMAVLAATYQQQVARREANERRKFLDDIEALFRTSLAELEATHNDTIWNGQIPSQAIYAALRESVIRQPCVRRDYFVSLALTADDPSGDAEQRSIDPESLLNVRASVRFMVENLSLHDVTFEHTAFLEKYYESDAPGRTRISRLAIHPSNPDRTEVLEGTLLPVEDRSSHVRLTKTIALGPRERVDVEMTYESVAKARDHWNWAMTHSTENATLSVHHPTGLDVRAFPLHPNLSGEFRQVVNALGEKAWELRGGFLPYQGIDVQWQVITHREP